MPSEKTHVTVRTRQTLAAELLTTKVANVIGKAGVSRSTLYRIKRKSQSILALRIGKDVKRNTKSLGRSVKHKILPKQPDTKAFMVHVRSAGKPLVGMNLAIYLKRKYRSWVEAYVATRIADKRVDRHDEALLDLRRSFMAAEGLSNKRTVTAKHSGPELQRIKARFSQSFWNENFACPEGKLLIDHRFTNLFSYTN